MRHRNKMDQKYVAEIKEGQRKKTVGKTRGSKDKDKTIEQNTKNYIPRKLLEENTSTKMYILKRSKR